MSEAKNGRQDRRRNIMLKEPVSKVIPKMAIPTIVAFLISSIYSLADTYFVSSLGTEATAAVSVNVSRWAARLLSRLPCMMRRPLPYTPTAICTVCG